LERVSNGLKQAALGGASPRDWADCRVVDLFDPFVIEKPLELRACGRPSADHWDAGRHEKRAPPVR